MSAFASMTPRGGPPGDCEADIPGDPTCPQGCRVTQLDLRLEGPAHSS